MSKYTMRKLKGTDIFAMSKILKKMGIKPDVKKGMTQEQLGVDMFVMVLENIHLAEDEINEFMSGLIGISKEEFAELELEEMMDIFAQFKEQKGLDTFFKQLGK